AGHLDENAVGALPLDVRLRCAERVDAAADDLDRLIDRAADTIQNPRIRQHELNEAVRAFPDVERGRGCDPQRVDAARLGLLTQAHDRFLAVRGLGDAHLHLPAGRTDAAGDANT